MEEIVRQLAIDIANTIGAPLATFLLAIIPIAEARLAILCGLEMGLAPGTAFGWAFFGSSLIAPILILAFMPIISWLSKTKLFSKIGRFLYDKFEKKSHTLNIDDTETKQYGKFKITKADIKKMSGLALFVAVPLPLTGVWTGSAVASILKIGFIKSVIGVIFGNAVACTIITLIGFFFYEQRTWITIAFLIITILVVLLLIVKFILFKPNAENNETAAACDNGTEKE